MKIKSLNILLIGCLISSFLAPIPQARAQGSLNLPEPGTMVSLSSSFEPVLMKGLIVHPENPLLFDFIVDVGQEKLEQPELKQQGEKLIKYFLASLAIPEEELWVNLSPYEKDRTIPMTLSQTDMGRDLLEQDYMLKQVTASLIYPEKQLGKTFWDKVYAKAQALYGTTEIPMNTFNKVWIIADRAEVYEQNNSVFVVDQHLKVMLEEDYLALQKHTALTAPTPNSTSTHITNQIIRDIVLPALETEVNRGKNFAQLRQIYNSLILASWYKNNLKDMLLNQVYSNQQKVRGIDLADKQIKEEIYQQYLKAYKKGVFNYIKEDIDQEHPQHRIPRKYFSGGLKPGAASKPQKTKDRKKLDSAMSGSLELKDFKVDLSLKQVDEAAIVDIDQAMAAGKRPDNYVRTITWFKEKEDELPQVRISDIYELEVGPEEEAIIREDIAKDGDIFLLSEDTLRLAKDGNIDIELTNEMGIIPPKYLNRKTKLSENLMELFDDFAPPTVPKDIAKHSRITVKAGGFFRIRIFDKVTNRYLYLVNLNGNELNSGRIKISPVGGGYQFLNDGLQRYKSKISSMTVMKGEKEKEIRKEIPGNRWPIFLSLFESGFGRETDALRELREELNGPAGVFRHGLPEHWLDPSKNRKPGVIKKARLAIESLPPAPAVTPVNGGIDLNPVNMQMKRQNHVDPIHNSALDLRQIQLIKEQGFNVLNFNIQSISPITNLLNLFYPQ